MKVVEEFTIPGKELRSVSRAPGGQYIVGTESRQVQAPAPPASLLPLARRAV
jgi:hypothetical protein